VTGTPDLTTVIWCERLDPFFRIEWEKEVAQIRAATSGSAA